jgi:hypothetical protein
MQRLSAEMSSRVEGMAEAQLRQGTRIRKMLVAQERTDATLSGIQRTLQRLEENTQKIERISPRGLATRVPIEKIEEARRIVRDAEAAGQPIAPVQPRGDDDITGVWAVLPGGRQVKVPNQWIRATAMAAIGALTAWLASLVHSIAQHWRTP